MKMLEITMIKWHELEERNRYRADIVVRSDGGWPIALVETKNQRNLTPESATAIRRNLTVHGIASERVQFFLLVSQDIGFLWVQQEHIEPEAPPTVAFSMKPVVRHYAQWLAPEERLLGGVLDYVVADWLSDIAAGNQPTLPEVTNPLLGTGFLESLRGAAVSFNERV